MKRLFLVLIIMALLLSMLSCDGCHDECFDEDGDGYCDKCEEKMPTEEPPIPDGDEEEENPDDISLPKIEF